MGASVLEASDAHYFGGYSDWGIHQLMIQDEVREMDGDIKLPLPNSALAPIFNCLSQIRTNTYRDSFLKGDNPKGIAGKVVMDVGAGAPSWRTAGFPPTNYTFRFHTNAPISGTGILSMFAIQAGASKVYAIDMAKIAGVARDIIKENGMEEKIVFINEKIESPAAARAIPQVDVIVSEWMGFCLLYEAMIESVVYARDHFLKAGGAMFPNRVILQIEAASDPAGRYGYWHEFQRKYQLTMYKLQELKFVHDQFRRAIVEVVQSKCDLSLFLYFPLFSSY